MPAPGGLRVRVQGAATIGTLRCGAATPEEAKVLADGYLARRGIRSEWRRTVRPDYTPKIGVAGYKAFDVEYLLPDGRPS